MAIKVELNPFFVEDAEGRTSFEMDCPTVGKCLEELVKRYPALMEKFFDRRGSCRAMWRSTSTANQPLRRGSFPLKDGDEVSVTVIAAGG